MILIAALLPKKIEDQIREISAKYQPKLFANKELPPHLTILPPTKVVADLKSVSSALLRVISQNRPLPIKINGIGTFRNKTNVAFFRVTRSPALDRLHQQINQSVKLLVMQRQKSQLPFKPHITFAKKMNNSELKKILADLKNFHPQYEFDLKEIGLYVLEEPWRSWRLSQKFSLATR